MSWSQSQLQMLHAMGHQPMVLASASGARHDAPPASTVSLQEQATATELAGGEFSKLLGAISRASGGRDVSGLVTDLAGLRRDPALKRALWPALRALRRTH